MSTQTLQDQYIKVGNINTRFWAVGNEGTTVILIHGHASSVEHWIYNINSLAKNHRVYAIDLAGFGRSARPPVLFTCSYGAQFVKDFTEVQHIEKASLVGNSAGGGVVLQFAIEFPDKVEKLVVANSWGLGKELNPLLRLATLPLIGELLTRPSRNGTFRSLKECVYDPAVLTDKWVESVYQLDALPRAQEYSLSALRGGNSVLGQRANARRSIVDNLSTITAPTLIIWGKQDRILPVAHAYVAQESMPNTELHIFNHCGHIPQLERPEEFNALVLEFLAK